MPVTPRGIRYPSPGDALADGAVAIQHTAEDVDALLAVGVIAKSTTPNASATTAAELRDVQLGDVAFVAVVGESYTIATTGNRAQTTVAGDTVDCIIRDGGAATPTTASPALAAGSVQLGVAGGAGATNIPVEITLDCKAAPANPWEIAAGTHTLSVFVKRTAGTGNVNLGVAAGTLRQLKVTHEGTT